MDEKILKNLNPNYTDGREKIESIEHVIYNVNRYIRSPEELNESFTEFITQVISKVLQHPIVYGQKGDEMASDLIFRCTKLFVNKVGATPVVNCNVLLETEAVAARPAPQ